MAKCLRLTQTRSPLRTRLCVGWQNMPVFRANPDPTAHFGAENAKTQQTVSDTFIVASLLFLCVEGEL